MNTEIAPYPAPARVAALSDPDFHRLSALVQAECGIRMPSVKKTMLEARLQKRLRSLGIRSCKEYCEYLFSREGMSEELIHFIDAVTTNKTDFFREPVHFEYLAAEILPQLLDRADAGVSRKIRAWSAGCSTGEEAYTLAMVLFDFTERQGMEFSVLATDICSHALEKARRAIYQSEAAAPIPHELKVKYLLRSKKAGCDHVRIVPELRERVQFKRLNFMDRTYLTGVPMHVIFCRNVLIYFNRQNQELILGRLCRHLIKGGYLFVGHSETLHNMRVPLVQVSPTIYRKTAGFSW